MKEKRMLRRVLTAVICLVMLLSLNPAVQVAAAELAEAQPQAGGGNQEGLILLLSAVAITGLVLLLAIRWGKKKFF